MNGYSGSILLIIDYPFLECEHEAISLEKLSPTEENVVGLLAFVAAHDHYKLQHTASLFQVCPQKGTIRFWW